MPVDYPIRAVSKLTGLPVDTLRAWERRYGVVQPARAARGRLYSDSDVKRLLLLRAAVESGHAIGQVAKLSDTELQTLVRTSLASPELLPDAPPPPAPVLQPVLAAIESWDYAATNEELTRLAVLANPRTLVLEIVLPLMRAAGERWENGTFQVAQEHMLSACVRNLLGGLIRVQTPHPQGLGARLLLTTPSTELHEFGILAAALLAVANGLSVTYLGPNLPAEEILEVANYYSPHAVVLGIMETNVTPFVKEHFSLLRTHLPLTTEIWLGGSGAAAISESAPRHGCHVLDTFVDFERHLTRLRASCSKEQ